MPEEPQLQPEAEKKELFRREEVRTMHKDLARLQEEEAIKERERMAGLRTEEEIKKERERIERLKKEEEEKMFAKKETIIQERVAAKAGEEKVAQAEIEELAKKALEEAKKKEVPKPSYRLPFRLPSRPTGFSKILSRVAVLVALIALWGVIITFWYWYFAIRPGQPPSPPPPQEEVLPPQELPPPEELPPTEELPPPEEAPPPVEQPTPQALIPVDSDSLIELSSPLDLPDLLSQAVQRYGGENILTRILIRNTQTGQFMTLSEFFQAFQMTSPSGLVEKLSPDFTLFVYSSLIANRLGFAAKIADAEGFENLVKSWEATLEQDTQNLFVLLGKRGESGAKNFRQAMYRGIMFRYISFPTINFGIVWSILNLTDPETGQTQYYFVFTSSGESMMRVIDRVEDRLIR